MQIPRIPVPDGIPIPRPPVGPDPLRRIDVPDDLGAVTSVGEEEDPRPVGMTPDGVERIWGAVERLYRSGVHPAIALCLRREGRVVLDRAIGHARGNGPDDDEAAVRMLATHETPFCIFSASKAITAMVVHLLDQRGDLHVDDRVAEYIPEYARHGKDAITLAHLIEHRAGVPNLPGDALDLDNIAHPELIMELLCDARPSSRPGKWVAYHAISGGFVLAEVVRRVTGRDVRAVLATEILEPLGFRWNNYGVAAEDVDRVAFSYATGLPTLPPLSTLLTRALGRPPDDVTRLANDPRFLTGIIPSANIVTTANELSRFFELLRRGGELDGVRIFEQRTIRRALTESAFREPDFTLAVPIRYASGLMLGARWLSLFGPDTDLAFGHLGFTNMLGWADPQRALSGALLTSGKPVVYPELPDVWAAMRRIGLEAPDVPESALAFESAVGESRRSG